MARLGGIVVVLASACGSRSKPACVKAVVACACSNGVGAQAYTADGTFELARARCQPRMSRSQEMAQGRRHADMWPESPQLHEIPGPGSDWLDTAQDGIRGPQHETIRESDRRAQHSLNSTRQALAGASYFEIGKAWDGLGCTADAMMAVASSLEVRPRDRGGWKETCDFCKSLGGSMWSVSLECFGNCSVPRLQDARGDTP